jgi:hypothetical protein
MPFLCVRLTLWNVGRDLGPWDITFSIMSLDTPGQIDGLRYVYTRTYDPREEACRSRTRK